MEAISGRDKRLKLYPQLAIACGYQVGKTISKSHLSRRLRRLGPLPFFLYFIYLVCQLIQAGVIVAKDLIIDSTTVLAWYHNDAEAGWGYAKKFGYKAHTIICRYSMLPLMLPLWFFVSSANRYDSPYARPLLQNVNLYKVVVEVVRADSAYWCYDFLRFIIFLGARVAVDYNVRRKNRSIVVRDWIGGSREWVKGAP